MPPLCCILLECMVLKKYDLMIHLRTMIGALLVLTIGMLILMKPLIDLMNIPLKADHQEILSMNVATIKVAKNGCGSLHHTCAFNN